MKDYSETMWKWLLNGVLADESADYRMDGLKTELHKVLNGWPGMVSGDDERDINKIKMAFNLMMNHYEGKVDATPYPDFVKPIVDLLLEDYPTIKRAFEIWIYG